MTIEEWEGNRRVPAKENLKVYRCHRAKSPVPIDGRLDHEVWKDCPWTDRFQDICGKSKAEPRFETKVKMMWDDDYFYVGAWMEETDVWGDLRKKNEIIFYDNDFEVFIDPDGDNANYYEFEVNCHNTIWELKLDYPYHVKNTAHHGWNLPGLKSAVFMDGQANDPHSPNTFWSVTIAFPWKDLAQFQTRKGGLNNGECPPSPGDSWRVNFSRVQWQSEIVDRKYVKKKGSDIDICDNWVWSPMGLVAMHHPDMWGYVYFDQSVAPSDRKLGREVAIDNNHFIRELLMAVYHFEDSYYRKHGRYVASLEQIKYPFPEHMSAIEVALMKEGYEASIKGDYLLSDDQIPFEGRWAIDHENVITCITK